MVEFDKRLDAIVQAEATKEALLQFSENLDMKIKDFSETQRRSLIDILVEKVEVTFN